MVSHMRCFPALVSRKITTLSSGATRRALRSLCGHVAALLVPLAIAAGSSPAQASPQYAALVLDAQNGRILHAANIDTQVHPASLTKIMTLYMVFDALRDGRLTMHQQIPISSRAASMPPSKLGLAAGQSIKVEDAIMALVTKSANDIAVAVAEALAGSESEFARQMTALAQSSLDMPNTVFMNASGLPDSRQVTTARDMVNLAIRMRAHFPEYYPLFATRSFTYQGVAHRNHNGLLRDYPGMDGIKTGFINASGFNLVASAEQNGLRVHGVIFGGRSAQTRNNRMAELLDYGFAHLGPVPDRPAFAPAARGGAPAGPTITTLVAATLTTTATDAAAATGEATATTTATTAATGPVPIIAARPAFAPAFRTDNPTIGDLISASEEQLAHYPSIRFAQLLTYVGADRPRPTPPAHADVHAAAGSSVPTPILLAALDPAKLEAAGLPDATNTACATGWGIQVGAFGEPAVARATAESVRQTAMLQNTAVLVEEVAVAGQMLYRSTLVGLPDASAAANACSQLHDQGHACAPAPPVDPSDQAVCS